MMLPHVVRFNAQDPTSRQAYIELARHAGLQGSVESLIEVLYRALQAAGFPACLGDLEIPESAVRQLAPEAAGQWTANFNPRSAGAADFESLYDAAYAGY